MPNSNQLPTCSSLDELVVRASQEREALGRLYDETYPDIFRYCLRRTANRSLAEDLTSSVFLSVAHSIHSFSGTCFEDFRRWLFRIATNEIHASYRKSVRRETLLEEAAHSGRLHVQDQAKPTSVENGDLIQQAILRLNQRAQAIVTMRYLSELSYEDIGQVLGISTGTARTAASRALESIREDIGSET